MPTTTHTPILTRQWSFPTDKQLEGKDGNAALGGIKRLRDMIADHVQKVSDVLTEYHLVGTLAERPSPGTYGRHFFATDNMTLYEDNGTAWAPIGGAAALAPSSSTMSLTIGPSAGTIFFLDTTSNNITVTLPPATGSMYAPILKKIEEPNNLFVQPAGSDLLDGESFPTGYLVTSIWRKLQLVDYASGKWAII